MEMCPLLLLLLLLIKSSRGVVGGVRGEVTRDRPTDQLSAGQPLRSAIFPTLLMVVKAVFCFQSFFLFTPTSSFSALAISSSSPSSRRGVSVQMVSNGDGWQIFVC